MRVNSTRASKEEQEKRKESWRGRTEEKCG